MGHPNPFPLALDFFNWHKHPGAPLGPSDADINHPDSASGKFADSPALGTVTFVIANRMDGRVRRMGNPLSHSYVLRGKRYRSPNDYLLTFWKLLRISDVERARREAWISETGLTEAVSFGIADRSGRLLHLDREVRIGSAIFGPDLHPVAVRLVRSE
ncbi:MAG: hypothetical protein QG650_577 [Patescibacteria group bacterium]|nr:hypothetical protein [Patescibacteria group bacterium]